MLPTLGNVDAEAYSAIFKEAGKLLRLRRIPGHDIHELCHAATERFFLTGGNESMLHCVDRVLMEEESKQPIESPVEELITLGDTGSIEATLDIYKLYLKVSDKFSGEEKIVFFSMLDENPMTGIADRLNMSPAKIQDLKKSILEKIKNAVPGAKNSRSSKASKK